MKSFTEIHRLPLHFDPEQLVTEVSQFTTADWISHPQEGAGNASLPLISVGGTPNVDYAISGPIRPTHALARCPYLQQVLQALGCPLSRCRLVRRVMRIDKHADEACNQVLGESLVSETTYHWFRRRPIYVPIVTDAAVTFACGTERIHMAAGEAWTFDPRTPHGFVVEAETQTRGDTGHNSDDITCIHLVIETKGSEFLRELLAPTEKAPRLEPQTVQAPYHLRQHGHLLLEPYAFEVLMPHELCKLIAFMLVEIREAQVAPEDFVELVKRIEQFQRQWQQVFDRFGHRPAGELAYQDLLLTFQEQIVRKASKWVGVEGNYTIAVIRSMLLTAPDPARQLRKQLGQQIHLQRQKKNVQLLVQQEIFQCPEFDRPLFIVSAPRAGSTLLFETLRHFPELWTTGEENHELIENIPALHPAAHDYHSNRLTAADAKPEIAALLRQRFAQHLQDRTGQLLIESPQAIRPTCVRFLEKTPKNALRIPFLKAVFPEARFLFLYREPGPNISSLIECWRTRRFIAYQPLPGWPYRDWSFLLVPGWQSMIGRPLAEIAAYQWQMANTTIADDLAMIPQADWSLVHYDDLVNEPRQTVQRIAQFTQLRWDNQIEERLSQALPVSSMAMSTPSADKWRKHAWHLDPLLPRVEAVFEQVNKLDPC